ncbi:hypothetical protein OROGR_008522 [Orobanche gracilis]
MEGGLDTLAGNYLAAARFGKGVGGLPIETQFGNLIHGNSVLVPD